jgi:hypothetical protein
LCLPPSWTVNICGWQNFRGLKPNDDSGDSHGGASLDAVPTVRRMAGKVGTPGSQQ